MRKCIVRAKALTSNNHNHANENKNARRRVLIICRFTPFFFRPEGEAGHKLAAGLGKGAEGHHGHHARPPELYLRSEVCMLLQASYADEQQTAIMNCNFMSWLSATNSLAI